MTLKEKLLSRYDLLDNRSRDIPKLSDNGIVSLASDIDNLYWEVAKYHPKDEREQPRELAKTITDMKAVSSIKRRSQLPTHKHQWREDLSIDLPVISKMISLLPDSTTDQ